MRHRHRHPYPSGRSRHINIPTPILFLVVQPDRNTKPSEARWPKEMIIPREQAPEHTVSSLKDRKMIKMGKWETDPIICN